MEWRVTSADGHPVNGTFTFRARVGAHLQTGSETPAVSSSALPTDGTSPTTGGSTSTTPEDVPSVSPAPTDSPTEGPSAWWWLLAVVPVGLAAVLGWRFSRRSGG